MMNRTTTLFAATLAAALLSAPASVVAATAGATNTSSASKLADLFGDPVVAKAKGVEIKRSELDKALVPIKANYTARGQNLGPDQTAMLEYQVLNEMVGVQLTLNKATDADKQKGREQFEKMLQRLKTDNKLTDEEFEQKLATQLRVQAITRAQWEQQIMDKATVALILERELKVGLSDEDVKKYYDEHPARFEQPEQVRASHILIGTRDPNTNTELTEEQKKAKRKLAEDLLKRAKAGEDFAKLAKEYSDDPGSKDKGGEYTFPRGQMVPEFEAAAFSLGTNQISDIIATQFGYHIIKLNEKIPAKKIELAKISEDLKEGLKQQEMQKLLPGYFEKLLQQANFEILDEKIKAASELKPPIQPVLPETKK
jgi:parvulin-like peptidyl-prolyl isomerase